MDWVERLNQGVNRLSVQGARVEILHWAHDPHLPDNQPHRHTYYEACLVGARGWGRFSVSGSEEALQPGTLFVARPGAVHQITNSSATKMDLRWVCFSWTANQPTADAANLLAHFAESPIHSAIAPEVSSTWSALERHAGSRPKMGDRETTRYLASALVVQIAQALGGARISQREPSERRRGATRAVTLAIRFLEDNLYRAISVAELASHACVSERQLHRLFLAQTSVTPGQFMLIARLDRASVLLRGDRASIKEIAAETGFSDSRYFTRCFGRRFGCAPGEYRRDPSLGRIVHNPGVLV